MQRYTPIVWNDDLVTGVAEIDDQHRILVKTLNEAGVKLAGTPDLPLLEQITRDLLSYAIYHFETEETLMAELDYLGHHPEEATAHAQAHRSFSAKVVAVRDGLKAGHAISRDDLLNFLNGWLVGHIMATDKKLAAFILQQRGAATA
ncbi:MAG: bacteriohemerythrin [Rhodoferax sp.]